MSLSWCYVIVVLLSRVLSPGIALGILVDPSGAMDLETFQAWSQQVFRDYECDKDGRQHLHCFHRHCLLALHGDDA